MQSAKENLKYTILCKCVNHCCYTYNILPTVCSFLCVILNIHLCTPQILCNAWIYCINFNVDFNYNQSGLFSK